LIEFARLLIGEVFYWTFSPWFVRNSLEQRQSRARNFWEVLNGQERKRAILRVLPFVVCACTDQTMAKPWNW
jgi:hypothetical protein